MNMRQSQTLHFILLLLTCCCVFASSSRVVESSPASSYLRGLHNLQTVDQQEQQQIIIGTQNEEEQQIHKRRIKADNNNNNEQTTLLNLFLSQPSTFQIILSIILSILTILQVTLFTTFLINRTKRVLEFAQPIVICIFLSCSIITTTTCFFYIYYNHNIICAIREPLMFGCVSCMGATVGGRAWRISMLLNNPLLSVGRSGSSGRSGNGSGSEDNGIPRIEKARQFTLRMLSELSGCEYSLMGVLSSSSSRRGGGGGGGGRPIRVQITFWQMIRATIIMIIPQLIWQMIVLSVPMLRPSRTLVSHSYSNTYYTIQYEQDYQDDDGVITMNQYQCQADVGFWPNYIGIILTVFPFAIAYLLNVRPKSELDQLPEIVDEREHLKSAFGIFVRILIVAVPMIGLTYNNNPAAKAYGAICAVLGLPLACCYHIAYVKLNTTKSNISKQQQRRMSSGGGSTTGTSALINGGDGTDGRSSAALAVRMAEMYSRIGRTEETVELVDETLSVFRKGNSGNLQNLVVQSDGRQEIASGFTVNDLKALEADELQMIIQLLRLKGNALIKLKGPAGFAMSAKLNIDALKIFENCPAADKMKDISLMFPIYNMVGIQLKGGVIDQDDECSLERDLAERFCHEAQLQAYHYARALANLAEMYGRMGVHDEAFEYFDVMKAVYMTQDHPKLLLEGYAVDRCAVSFATSALWYLQRGQIDKALERCDYVIDQVLPPYDKKDIIGLYTIFVQIGRVLKWNGHVDKAREVCEKFIPDAADTHFAVGCIHKSISLLLRICEGSSLKYDLESGDIEHALTCDVSDMTDHNFTADGWSMKSMTAELCLSLARRLDAGDPNRERLVDRGIMMTTVAQQRVKASNGMVKHVLAYEANRDIHLELLLLAKEEVAVSRAVIYDRNEQLRRSLSNRRDSMNGLKDSVTSKSTHTFANRFTVKDESSNSNGSGKASATSSSSPAPTHVSIATKKKVAFSRMSSQMSSFGSTGSGSRHSYHSHHSQEESIKEEEGEEEESSSHVLKSVIESKECNGNDKSSIEVTTVMSTATSSATEAK